MKPLSGKVALVAGATRGAGRGIAAELGTAGAVVYCSGRSTRSQASDLNRPETIEETAEMVSSLGGVGIAARTDHSDEAQVAALLERIRNEQGRLDILVNDIWGAEKLVQWGKAFYELEPAAGFRVLERAIFTHIITARHAAPLMLETADLPGGGGLLLEITDGDLNRYRGQLYYDLAKHSVIRLAFAFAHEFGGHGFRDVRGNPVPLVGRAITAAALTPGFLRSEEMLEYFGVTAQTWHQASDPDFVACSETPRFIGRAVAALAADPERARFAGRALSSWGLSEVYRFTDLDGTRPHWGRHFAAHYPRALE